jgi:hypothetical protein
VALTDERFYDWQFKSLPLTSGMDECVVAYDAETQTVAGVVGLNERPFFLNGSAIRGAELTSWVVSEEFRGLGPANRMLTHIQDRFDMCLAMGISAKALPLYMRLGFRYLRAIPRYLRVLDVDAIGPIGTLDPVAKMMARQWIDQPRPAVPYSVADGPSVDLDRLFHLFSDSHNAFARDRAHLDWRYFRHPHFEYKTFEVRSPSGGSCLVVLRREAAVPGVIIYHLLDCFGDESAMPAALAFIEDYCREQGAHVVDFFSTSYRIARFFLSSGWFSMNDDPGVRIAHLFHPVEYREPPTTSLIFWSRTCFADMCDYSKLYVTKADADFDRPVFGSAT